MAGFRGSKGAIALVAALLLSRAVCARAAPDAAPPSGMAGSAGSSLASAVSSRLSSSLGGVARVAEIYETTQPGPAALRSLLSKEAESLSKTSGLAFTL